MIESQGPPSPQVEVLSETYPDGLAWHVLAGYAPPDHLMTMLRCERDGIVTSEAGFGGAPWVDESPIDEWVGQSTGEPTFVMVRARPDVTSVVAVLTSGRRVPLKLSDVVDQFRLKFGAARIEDGEWLARLDVTATLSRANWAAVRSTRWPRSSHG
jgi:hypothetical protein